MRKAKTILAVAALAACLAQAVPAQAQMEVNTVQSLGFGRFLLLNNNGQHAITVTPQGVTSYPAALVSIDDAQNGIYALSGFNPDTDVFVTFDPPSLPLACVCGGPVLTVDNFTLDPAMPHTDPAGAETIRIGARLRTDGTQAFYQAGTYTGQLTMIVNH